MSKYYNISFPRLVLLLLPTMLRKNVMVGLLTSLVKPLTVINSKFEEYRSRIDTSVSSQVCYMSALVNNRYDYHERRIAIRDVQVDYDDFFIFSEGEGIARLIDDESSQIFWVDNGKLGSTNPDFEIVFPAGYELTGNEEKELVKLINNNKLASKKFRIVYE